MSMKKHIIFAVTVGLSTGLSNAAVSFTGADLLQDFDLYDGSAGPAGWDAGGFSTGSGFTENRGISSGGVTTGGTYAFDIGSGNIALGVQPTGTDFTEGYYELEVTNDSGATVAAWELGFNSYSYNNAERANSFNFSYSINGINYTAVAAGSFTSVGTSDPPPAWTLGVAYNETIVASVASGGSLFLRWEGDDVSGAGTRDEFALDDVSIVAIPEPSTLALIGLAGLSMIFRRRH